MARKKKAGTPKRVETLTHEDAKRKNIPTAELQSAAQRVEEQAPVEPVVYARAKPLSEGETRPRDEDLDPQLVWKGARVHLSEEQLSEAAETGYITIDDTQLVWSGKDQQDWSDLVVQSPPLYIQEKIHPKVIIDDLMKKTEESRETEGDTFDLFDDFNGIEPGAKAEFYEHDQNWSNRMILGDSLQVMASLAERESLRGKVQCIYFDPPYGIKFNSNWQVSTRSRDVKDGKLEQITREPEQVKAFRDTWLDGAHSYLTYLRDRLTAMRDLLTDSGSIFVQIGDENVHRVRAVMEEVFGEENFVSLISFNKSSGLGSVMLPTANDYIVYFARNKKNLKFRPLNKIKTGEAGSVGRYRNAMNAAGDIIPASRIPKNDEDQWKLCTYSDLTKPGPGRKYSFEFQGEVFDSGQRWWGMPPESMDRACKSGRIRKTGKSVSFVRLLEDSATFPINNVWMSIGGVMSRSDPKIYVVQTSSAAVQRCVLMSTDPGDLVLDPTCGSGTTSYVAEQWGRRWITIDTSRVALALARSRLIGARYPYYFLADSPEGREVEQEVTGKIQTDSPTSGDIRQGFVYERAPYVTLKTIANNTEIDVIWENYKSRLSTLLQEFRSEVGQEFEEWEIPREAEDKWSESATKLHAAFWDLQIQRQAEIDKSIAQKADVEFLYDRPYEDKSRVRVSGPFTVESLSPHRVVPSDEADILGIAADSSSQPEIVIGPRDDFTQMIMDHLRSAGVHQAAKDDKIEFTSLDGWPGSYVAAEGHFLEGEIERRSGIFIGPEFGTVTRADLTAAAREALDARFDVLIACGFNFAAHTSELDKLGPLPILKAKINPDLHMSEELKNTGTGNLFIIFGEPDIAWDFNEDGEIEVEVLGVDVFDPKSGDVRASGKDDIAAWFIDTDYNEESFFVRHAYFLGAQDPYKALKTSLKAEINKEAWETLYRDKSRAFPRPEGGRFAVKVINHFGDEVMKVFAV